MRMKLSDARFAETSKPETRITENRLEPISPKLPKVTAGKGLWPPLICRRRTSITIAKIYSYVFLWVGRRIATAPNTRLAPRGDQQKTVGPAEISKPRLNRFLLSALRFRLPRERCKARRLFIRRGMRHLHRLLIRRCHGIAKVVRGTRYLQGAYLNRKGTLAGAGRSGRRRVRVGILLGLRNRR